MRAWRQLSFTFSGSFLAISRRDSRSRPGGGGTLLVKIDSFLESRRELEAMKAFELVMRRESIISKPIIIKYHYYVAKNIKLIL